MKPSKIALWASIAIVSLAILIVGDASPEHPTNPLEPPSCGRQHDN